jgi:GNAT superfamily N-acetyltransferase
MEVHVRVATFSDIDMLGEALGPGHRDFFHSRFPLQVAGLGLILIAYRDTRPLGAVFISWDDADEPEIREHLAQVPMIFHLHVARPHRGKGVGRQLLREAENWLRKLGFDRVLLGVDKSNDKARRLYLRLGYVQPAEPELSDLGSAVEPGQEEYSMGEAYDILVADLYRDSESS